MAEYRTVSTAEAKLYQEDTDTTDDNVVEGVFPEAPAEVEAKATTVEQEPEPDRKAKKREYEEIALLIVSVALIAVIIALAVTWYLKENQSIEGLQAVVAEQEFELEEVQANRLIVSEALVTKESELTDLRIELAQTKSALGVAVDPVVVEQLEAQLEEQISLVADSSAEVARQVELVAQTELELEVAQAALTEAEIQLDKAQVQAKTEAARANQAQVALAGEVELVPVRIENMFDSLSAVSLSSTKYDLGEVVREIQRPGIWDDETQYFVGSGVIGYVNNLDKVKARWLDSNTLQVTLPLPVVESHEEVVLVDYETRTEREQFARIGGRWGEQTTMLVLEDAQLKTREIACTDAKALRASTTQLKQMAYQLGRGHSVNIRWSDSSGGVWSSVSDAQLLGSAC